LEVPGFENTLESARQALIPVIKKILNALAIHFKLKDEEFFLSKHKHLDNPAIKTRDVFRAYHFYSIKPANGTVGDYMRLAEHSARGTLVFIYPDQISGQESQDKVTKEWIPVELVENSVRVFPGLMLENLTDG